MLLTRGRKMGLALLGGPPPRDALLRDWIRAADLYVAADQAGGRPLPRLPDAIIGDMDSLERPPAGVPLVEDRDADSTDAEKCLRHLEEQGCDRIVFLGGFGQRPDHSLVNLALPLRRPGEILLAADGFAARGVQGSLILELRPGRGLSLFSLEGPVRGLNLRGVEFPLENADLDSIRGLTASNRVLDSRVELEVPSGRVLLLVEARPGDPLWQKEAP